MGANAPSDPVVLKVGGRALEGDGACAELASSLRSLGAPAVVVHGGGAEVSAWSRRLGLAPSFVDGRRVTDAASLEVAVAVLAGLANKRMVAALRAEGVDAIGLAALDGVAACAPHLDAARLGHVGQVVGLATSLLEGLLHEGRVPVLASIGAQGRRLLNLNADDLACAVAAALHARALVLLSDVAGVRLGGAVASRLSAREVTAALAGAEVTGGMRAKLEAAGAALDRGVGAVHVASWSGPDTLERLLGGDALGTTITARETCDV